MTKVQRRLFKSLQKITGIDSDSLQNDHFIIALKILKAAAQ